MLSPWRSPRLPAAPTVLEIEVHDEPSHAWSDGAQALTPDQFDDTMRRIRAIREVVCQETIQE